MKAINNEGNNNNARNRRETEKGKWGMLKVNFAFRVDFSRSLVSALA